MVHQAFFVCAVLASPDDTEHLAFGDVRLILVDRCLHTLQEWLMDAHREDCGWWERLQIGLKFESTLLVLSFWGIFVIIGASVGIVLQHGRLLLKGRRRISEYKRMAWH